jgi:drug/metabolite transporter (DMT)-like permease
MMRGIIVLITALLSVAFLGKKQYIHHWSSLVTIVVGVAVVGLVGIEMSNKHPDPDSNVTPTKPLGVILLLIA